MGSGDGARAAVDVKHKNTAFVVMNFSGENNTNTNESNLHRKRNPFLKNDWAQWRRSMQKRTHEVLLQ